MTHPVVWFEVMGDDGAELRRFYGDAVPLEDRRGQSDELRHGRGGRRDAASRAASANSPTSRSRASRSTWRPPTSRRVCWRACELGGGVLMPRTELPGGHDHRHVRGPRRQPDRSGGGAGGLGPIWPAQHTMAPHATSRSAVPHHPAAPRARPRANRAVARGAARGVGPHVYRDVRDRPHPARRSRARPASATRFATTTCRR